VNVPAEFEAVELTSKQQTHTLAREVSKMAAEERVTITHRAGDTLSDILPDDPVAGLTEKERIAREAKLKKAAARAEAKRRARSDQYGDTPINQLTDLEDPADDLDEEDFQSLEEEMDYEAMEAALDSPEDEDEDEDENVTSFRTEMGIDWDVGIQPWTKRYSTATKRYGKSREVLSSIAGVEREHSTTNVVADRIDTFIRKNWA
jgi:hypothetical protein